MQRIQATLVGAVGFLSLASSAAVATADTPDNPYKVISVRNAFDLQPPKEAPAPKKAPEQPKSEIKFVGISSINHVKRAHLVVPNKGGFFYYDLEEGVSRDGITVLQIDEANESVKVSNAGTELVLNESNSFTSPKSPGIPALPNTPGYTPPPGFPGVAPAIPMAQPIKTASSPAANSGPTIVSRNSGPNTTSPTPLPGAGFAPATSPFGSRANAGDTAAASGLRTIPQRAVRTVPTPQSNLSPEEQVVMMEAQRLRAAQRGIPLPPTPGVPATPAASVP